ncbi:hypothetical protein RB195_023965 [Necator americanus]|uniref:Uncharacterized protein n=1 Tax=Necator americanus TaxID=51031 RepID=A0ABR1ELH8_NECAM
MALGCQVRDGIRSPIPGQRSKIRDAAAFAKESKIWWAGHVMHFNDNRWNRAVGDWVHLDIMRTIGRPPTRWSDFFTKSFKESYYALRVPRERGNHWATPAIGINGRIAGAAGPVRRTTGVKVIKVMKTA